MNGSHINRKGIKCIILCCFCIVLFGCKQKPIESAEVQHEIAFDGWKTGISKAVITPDDTIWMAGYAARQKPGQDVIHDLWAKAFAVEDKYGTRGVLIATDLVGFTKEITGRIKKQIHEKYGLSEQQVILNSSHTHSGPVLEGLLSDIYPEDINKDQRISLYTQKLEQQIVAMVGEAFASLEPSKIYFRNSVSRFQVNRRNNSEKDLELQTELKGPNDYAVPVIKVTDLKGNLSAVLFGYACHPTVLSGYSWSGDYVGFAQIALEEKYPGTQAMFFQGACGDQNPLPRRSVSLAKQYGLTLAASVECALEEEMMELKPALKTAYGCIDLPFDEFPTREVLEKIQKESTLDYYKRWAGRLLTILEKDGGFRSTYPYPIQIWNMGDLPIVALGGEVVIEYAIGVKRKYGQKAFVMAYCNEVMAYIPSRTVLKEGGYEGDTSQRAYGMPAKWSEEIEPMIYHEIDKLMKDVELTQ